MDRRRSRYQGERPTAGSSAPSRSRRPGESPARSSLVLVLLDNCLDTPRGLSRRLTTAGLWSDHQGRTPAGPPAPTSRESLLKTSCRISGAISCRTTGTATARGPGRYRSQPWSISPSILALVILSAEAQGERRSHSVPVVPSARAQGEQLQDHRRCSSSSRPAKPTFPNRPKILISGPES